jgi:hypothetical protein
MRRGRTPHPDDPDTRPPRQGFLSLVPRRSLWKVAALLLLLAGVLYFQRRADRVAREMTKVINLSPPGAGAAPASHAPASRPPGP